MKNFIVKNDLQKYGVEVILSTDFNFDVELANYIGGNNELVPLVNSAKPFVFFIKNDSSKEIVGVSLRWTFNDSKKGDLNISRMESNPGVLMGIKPLDPNMVGKTSIINSKETRFYSYFNPVVEQAIVFANKRVKNPAVKIPILNSKEIQELISLAEYQKFIFFGELVQVSIDGIFFNDGTFAGEDLNFFFDSMNGGIQAKKDFLSKLNEAKLAGKDSEFLTEFLSKTPEKLSSRIMAGPGPVYISSNQAFEQSYKATLINLKREINVKKSHSLADSFIVGQIQSVKVSDFVNLCKLS